MKNTDTAHSFEHSLDLIKHGGVSIMLWGFISWREEEAGQRW